MYRFLALLSVATTLLVTGCAPRPAVEEPPIEGPIAYPEHSLAHILAAMQAVAAADQIVAFSSSGRLALRSPEQNLDGTALLRQRGTDTLWASVRGPLNIEVARALFTPDSFRVHDRLRNQLLVGTAAAAQQLFPGVTGIEDVFRTLTGTLQPDPAVRWAVTPGEVDEARAYWLTALDGRTRIAVDAAHWRVRRYERLGPAGHVVDSRRFSNFATVDGRVLPRRIVLSNPADASEVTLEHRTIELNPTTLTFPFGAGNARRIPFGSSVSPSN